ncbi:MAG: DUF1444 family protein [Myxococcaceae bacterium]
MATERLAQLELKVQSGEPLTDKEFEELESAARNDGDPRLRFAVGHALINAEKAELSLPLFQALIRDHPTLLEGKLGLARAYIALERYRAAEEILREVHAAQPEDPEPMKALAILALRSGARDRAQKLIDEALKLDPFDGEAQLVAAELAAPGEVPNPEAPGVQIASEKAFIDALLAELKAQKVQHLRRNSDVFLKAPSGHLARVDLRALYESYVTETRPLQSVVTQFAQQLGTVGSAPELTREELLEKVRPVLRGADFQSKAAGSASTEVSSELRLFYALDDPELVRYLPTSLLSQHGLDVAWLHRRAMENLQKKPLELKRVRLDGAHVLPTGAGSGLVALWEGDGYDGARLLLPEVQAQLRETLGGGALRVHLGRRELVIACRESDPESVQSLDALSPLDGIAGSFLLSEDGALTKRA